MESGEEHRGARRLWRELREWAVHQLHPEPRLPAALCRCADQPGDAAHLRHSGVYLLLAHLSQERLWNPAGGGQLLGEQELPSAVCAGVEPRCPTHTAWRDCAECGLE